MMKLNAVIDIAQPSFVSSQHVVAFRISYGVVEQLVSPNSKNDEDDDDDCGERKGSIMI